MALRTLKPTLRTLATGLRSVSGTTNPDSWRVGKTTAERGYGWTWQKARRAFLARPENVLCRSCSARGRTVVATVVDHIIPHQGDQALFWDAGNWQPLCERCHNRKTATEDSGTGRAMTHPEWLPTPACPVVVVTGPPGAGKTTYCREHARAEDEIIDLDECYRAVCGVHGHEADRAHLPAAIRYRNRLLADLAAQEAARAFFIVMAPSSKEVGWWIGKLDASHVLLDPGMDACLSRVAERRHGAVRAWYAAAERDDWRHPSARLA